MWHLKKKNDLGAYFGESMAPFLLACSINMQDVLFIKVWYLICLLVVFWLAVFGTRIIFIFYLYPALI